MNTRASASQLGQAWKDLALRWEQTQGHWRDTKSEEFEREYLTDLPSHLARAAAAIEELDGVLRKVRHDCE